MTAAAVSPVPTAVMIARLGRVVRQRLERTLAPAGLHQRELVALSYLGEHGPTPQQALAERLRMDASSLVCLLNDLEDGGLIVRRRDRSDRRRGIVELSPRGERTVARVDQELRAIDEELLAGVGSDERALLHRLLARMNACAPDWGGMAAAEG